MTTNKDQLIQDLAMMIRRLSVKLKAADPERNDKILRQAKGLLERNGLQGNVLRANEQTREDR